MKWDAGDLKVGLFGELNDSLLRRFECSSYKQILLTVHGQSHDNQSTLIISLNLLFLSLITLESHPSVT